MTADGIWCVISCRAVRAGLKSQVRPRLSYIRQRIDFNDIYREATRALDTGRASAIINLPVHP